MRVLYCSTGASCCEICAKGCLCPGCQVYIDYELSRIYWCDKVEAGLSRVVMRKQRLHEDPGFYSSVVDIKQRALTGESIVVSMGSQKKLPFSLEGLHLVPAQVHRIPLNREDEVKTDVVIGPAAEKPLRVPIPVMISGMSFGATSKNVHSIIARAASKLRFAFNSGEGGVLHEVLDTAADRMICQYSTGRFGVTDDILRRASAIEIRFGQGAYPGKGSFLPAAKMTPEVAAVRGLRIDEDAYSPAHHADMTNPEQIRQKVAWLKKLTGGVPIGAKIGCGAIEEDIGVLIGAGVDFIAIDGFGGGTGATDDYVRDNVGIPLVAALPRAARELTRLGVRDRVSLIADGGIRTSADAVRCLALGADAVYIGTAALIAMNCEQYRICHTGLCPTGVTTQDPTLMKQLEVESGTTRLSNFIEVMKEEIRQLTRIVGKTDIRDLEPDDLVAMNRDLAIVTGCSFIDGNRYSR